MNFLWLWHHSRGIHAVGVRKRSSRHRTSSTLLKRSSPFLLRPCTDAFNIIILQTICICYLFSKGKSFFSLSVNTFLSRLYLCLIFLSFSQHLLVKILICISLQSPSFPLRPVLQQLLCKYLQFPTFTLHFYTHLRYFFQNSLSGNEMANFCWLT